MNRVLQTSERVLISLSAEELLGVVNALNEVCNGIHIHEAEFTSRLGVARSVLEDLHKGLLAAPAEAFASYECLDVWAEPASVMVRAVSVYGDAVELSTTEAETLVNRLKTSIEAAS
jgi:hypothetical protein